MLKPFAHGLAGAALVLVLRAAFGGDAAALPLQGAAKPGGYAPQVATRSVFVNGIDVSSARSLEMKSVDLLINEQGDVFINAPHYQVNEEDSYIPLSKYVQGAATPEHKAMQKIGGPAPGAGPVPVSTPGAPVNSPLPSPEPAEAPAAAPDAIGQAALQEKPGVKLDAPQGANP